MTCCPRYQLATKSANGAEVSVIYHTFIEKCKMCGVSTLEYFKEFFKAIMQGRTDYENMLPMTIGINNNKFDLDAPGGKNYLKRWF